MQKKYACLPIETLPTETFKSVHQASFRVTPQKLPLAALVGIYIMLLVIFVGQVTTPFSITLK
jgi:hypothetical protein